MKLARAFFFVSIAVGALVWSACVGDDPSSATTGSDAGGPGSLDQPCFGNGTCNSGLSCISNVCVDLDGAVGGDASTEDGSKQNVDSGLVCDAGPIYANEKSIPCPPPEADCEAGVAECCAQTTGTLCPTPTTSCDVSTGARIACVLSSQCDVTQVCCLGVPSGTSFVDTTCPRTATLNEGICLSSCPTEQRQACVLDKDCVGGMTCHPYQITYNKTILSSPLVIGLCAAN